MTRQSPIVTLGDVLPTTSILPETLLLWLLSIILEDDPLDTVKAVLFFQESTCAAQKL